ncbi:hypothetical protein Gotur_003111 [Gossypium turneri]
MEQSTHRRLVWNGDGGFEDKNGSSGLSRNPVRASRNVSREDNQKELSGANLKLCINCPTTRSMAFNVIEQGDSTALTSNSARPYNKAKRTFGIGLYTKIDSGEHILNYGVSSERVVTWKRKIGAFTSQINHKQAVTRRQLQQETSNARKKDRDGIVRADVPLRRAESKYSVEQVGVTVEFNAGELNGVSYSDPAAVKKYARCAQLGEIFELV